MSGFTYTTVEVGLRIHGGRICGMKSEYDRSATVPGIARTFTTYIAICYANLPYFPELCTPRNSAPFDGIFAKIVDI